MLRLLLALAVALLASAPAPACWTAIDPALFGQGCPVIVRWPIVAVDDGPAGRDRADDVAHIRVDEVVRNDLTDVPLKVGDRLAVRMVSARSRVRESTDLRCPVGAEAIWLVVLTAQGEFRVDAHPVQKQAPADREKLRLGGAGERKTKAEWVAGQKAAAGQRGQSPAEKVRRAEPLKEGRE
jgi:hypothetical protein